MKPTGVVADMLGEVVFPGETFRAECTGKGRFTRVLPYMGGQVVLSRELVSTVETFERHFP